MHRPILIFIFVFMLGGCATPTTKYYLPPDATIRNELGTVYLDVVPFSYSGNFEEPIKGKGKGTLHGTGIGALTPIIALMLAGSCYDQYSCSIGLALGLALVPVGAVIGGIYGATATSTEEEVNAALEKFEYVVSNYEYVKVLEEKFLYQSRQAANKYFISPIENRNSEKLPNSTVLELRFIEMKWISEGKFNPDLYLDLEIEANFLKGKNVNSIYNRKWHYSNYSRNMYELLDNDSEQLKDEMTNAFSVVSQSIIKDLFLATEPEKENKYPERGVVYTVSSSKEQVKKINAKSTTIHETIAISMFSAVSNFH